MWWVNKGGITRWVSVGDGVVFSQSPRADMTSPIIVIPGEIQKGLHRLVKNRDEDDGDVAVRLSYA